MAYINGFGQMCDGSPPYYDDRNGEDFGAIDWAGETSEPAEPGEKLWVTKEGEIIPYSELTDKHLANIKKMLDARAVTLLNLLIDIDAEMDRRGLL